MFDTGFGFWHIRRTTLDNGQHLNTKVRPLLIRKSTLIQESHFCILGIVGMYNCINHRRSGHRISFVSSGCPWVGLGSALWRVVGNVSFQLFKKPNVSFKRYNLRCWGHKHVSSIFVPPISSGGTPCLARSTLRWTVRTMWWKAGLRNSYLKYCQEMYDGKFGPGALRDW